MRVRSKSTCCIDEGTRFLRKYEPTDAVTYVALAVDARMVPVPVKVGGYGKEFGCPR
jgi:hypothetical protein